MVHWLRTTTTTPKDATVKRSKSRRCKEPRIKRIRDVGTVADSKSEDEREEEQNVDEMSTHHFRFVDEAYHIVLEVEERLSRKWQHNCRG
jgi:hypothetical protein